MVGWIASLAFSLFSVHVRATAISSVPAATRTSSPVSAPRVVTDELGRKVTIPAEVHRIVSLAPSITEMIYALHLDNLLAGDTDYCDVPEAAKSKPHVGSVISPNFEAVVALHPDVVLAVAYGGNRRETVEALDKLGVPVYVINPQTVLKMLGSMNDIAKIAGIEAEGSSVVSQMKFRLDGLHMKLADLPLVHVLFVVQFDPLITIGQRTFIADALRYAGGESIVISKQDWPQLSLEEVVRLQPDYIVMATSKMGEGPRTVQDLRSHAVWKDLQAVQLGSIAVVSEEIDRPAPGLIDAIEQLAHQIHPDAFSRIHPGQAQSNFQATAFLPLRDPALARSQPCAH